MMNKNFLAGLAVGLFKRVYYITKMPVFSAFPSYNYIRLYWIYPLDGSVASVKIVRKLGNYPQTISDGTLVYSGTDISYNDIDTVKGTTYYYRLFPHDADGSLIDSQDVVSATVSTATRYKLRNDKVRGWYGIIYYYGGVYNNSVGVYTENSYIVKCKILESYPDNTIFQNIVSRYGIGLFLKGTRLFIKLAPVANYGLTENWNLINNIDTGINVVIGTDYCFGLQYNASTVEIYVNGAKAFTCANIQQGNPFGVFSVAEEEEPYYGTRMDMYEIQVWSKMLNDAEALFYAQHTPMSNLNNLVLLNDFTEGAGTTLYNKGNGANSSVSSAEYNGAIATPVWISLDVPKNTWEYVKTKSWNYIASKTWQNVKDGDI